MYDEYIMVHFKINNIGGWDGGIVVGIDQDNVSEFKYYSKNNNFASAHRAAINGESFWGYRSDGELISNQLEQHLDSIQEWELGEYGAGDDIYMKIIFLRTEKYGELWFSNDLDDGWINTGYTIKKQKGKQMKICVSLCSQKDEISSVRLVSVKVKKNDWSNIDHLSLIPFR